MAPRCPLLASLLCACFALSCAPKGGASLPGAKPFPEEARAMKAALDAPSPETWARLAHIRAQYASRYLKYAEEKGDGAALELAASYARSAAELVSESAQYWTLLALIHAACPTTYESRAMGLEAAARALELDPINKDALLVTADLALRDGQFALSASSIEKLVDADLSAAGRKLMAAYVQARNGDRAWSRGIEALDRWIARQDGAYLRVARALLREARGEREAAFADLDAAASLPTDDPNFGGWVYKVKAGLEKGGAL